MLYEIFHDHSEKLLKHRSDYLRSKFPLRWKIMPAKVTKTCLKAVAEFNADFEKTTVFQVELTTTT